MCVKEREWKRESWRAREKGAESEQVKGGERERKRKRKKEKEEEKERKTESEKDRE